MQTDDLTIDEVAAVMRCSGMTIRRRYAAGKFPKPYKDGHKIRWKLEDVENFIAEQTPRVNRIKKLTRKNKEQVTI